MDKEKLIPLGTALLTAIVVPALALAIRVASGKPANHDEEIISEWIRDFVRRRV